MDHRWAHLDRQLGHVDTYQRHWDQHCGHWDHYWGHADRHKGYFGNAQGHVDRHWCDLDHHFGSLRPPFGSLGPPFGSLGPPSGSIGPLPRSCGPPFESLGLVFGSYGLRGPCGQHNPCRSLELFGLLKSFGSLLASNESLWGSVKSSPGLSGPVRWLCIHKERATFRMTWRVTRKEEPSEHQLYRGLTSQLQRGQQASVALVVAKSRVTPDKASTIPRIELAAAVLSASVTAMI